MTLTTTPGDDLSAPGDPAGREADAGTEQLPPIELEGVDPLSSAVFRAYIRTLQLHRQLMVRVLADEGAHPGQAFCLRVLARNDGMSQRELAATLHVTPPTVTTMLQRLERGGSIIRREDEADQRITRVYLTDVGRLLEQDLRRVFAEHARWLFDSMTEDERREFERLLRLMGDNAAHALALLGGATDATPGEPGAPGHEKPAAPAASANPDRPTR